MYCLPEIKTMYVHVVPKSFHRCLKLPVLEKWMMNWPRNIWYPTVWNLLSNKNIRVYINCVHWKYAKNNIQITIGGYDVTNIDIINKST